MDIQDTQIHKVANTPWKMKRKRWACDCAITAPFLERGKFTDQSTFQIKPNYQIFNESLCYIFNTFNRYSLHGRYLSLMNNIKFKTLSNACQGLIQIKGVDQFLEKKISGYDKALSLLFYRIWDRFWVAPFQKASMTVQIYWRSKCKVKTKQKTKFRGGHRALQIFQDFLKKNFCICSILFIYIFPLFPTGRIMIFDITCI